MTRSYVSDAQRPRALFGLGVSTEPKEYALGQGSDPNGPREGYDPSPIHARQCPTLSLALLRAITTTPGASQRRTCKEDVIHASVSREVQQCAACAGIQARSSRIA